MTKISYVDALNYAIDNLLKLTAQNSVEGSDHDEFQNAMEYVDRLTDLRTSLENRAKSAKVRAEKKRATDNETFQTLVFEVLADKDLTAGEIAAYVTERSGSTVSVQKMSAMLSKMVKEGSVNKFTEKRKSIFTLRKVEEQATTEEGA